MTPANTTIFESRINDGVLPYENLEELSQQLQKLGLEEMSGILVTNFYPPDDEYPSFFSNEPLPDACGFTCIDSLNEVYGMSFLNRLEDNADELRLSRQGTKPLALAMEPFRTTPSSRRNGRGKLTLPRIFMTRLASSSSNLLARQRISIRRIMPFLSSKKIPSGQASRNPSSKTLESSAMSKNSPKLSPVSTPKPLRRKCSTKLACLSSH